MREGGHGGTLALVLSGGGARAAYQVGVLSAIAEIAPNLVIPIHTGVSAGGLNSTFLAAHRGPFKLAVAELESQWARLEPQRVYAVRPTHVGRGALRWVVNMIRSRRVPQPSLRGLMDGSPLMTFLQACIRFDGIQRNIDEGRLRAVGLSATCYSGGQTVTFVQGIGELSLWQRHMRQARRADLAVEHLMASAAIPLVFPAVRIGDAFYGDGSVRQTAPLAPAIHLGADRIIAVSMRTSTPTSSCPPAVIGDYPVAAQVFGLLLHSVFLDILDADAERLERLNGLLERVPESQLPADGIRPIDLLLLRPSRDLGGLASAHPIQLPPLVRFLVSSIGGGWERSADFLSYLMFHPSYTGLLMELGYEDTRARRADVERFLDGS
jgi:NTE family protein